MTIPVIAPFSPVPVPVFPITNITPFTYRDGITYVELLESMRQWLTTNLLPEFEETTNDLIELVEEALAQQSDWVASEINQLIQYVNQAINDIIDSSVEIQDPLVAQMINNPASATRQAGDAVWAAESVADDVDNLSEIISEGRLSQDNLDITYQHDVLLAGTGIDPTGATYSTTAIQAILDANPGRRCVLPEGVYKIGQLRLSAGQHLTGVGQQDWRDRFSLMNTPGWMDNNNFNGTVLRCPELSGVAITLCDDSEVNSGGISNLTLIGPGGGDSIGIEIGTNTITVVNAYLQAVKVGNFKTGIRTHYMNEASFYNVMIRGCELGFDMFYKSIQNAFYTLDIQWCGDGLKISADSVANAFYSLICQSNVRIGTICSGIKNAFHSGYWENNGARAIHLTGSTYGNVIDAPFVNNASDSILIDTGAQHNVISGYGGYGALAVVENKGIGTFLQGRFEHLTDTGLETIVVDAEAKGTVEGPPMPYTPVIAGITPGNGTKKCTWRRNGGRVEGEITFVVGSTTVMTGVMTITSPAPPSNGQGGRPISVLFFNVGDAWYRGWGYITAGGSINVGVEGANGSLSPFTPTVPFAWTADDVVSVNFAYEADW